VTANQIKKIIRIIVLVVIGLCINIYIGGFADYSGTYHDLSLSSGSVSTGVLEPGTVLRQAIETTDESIVSLKVKLGTVGVPHFSYELSQGDTVLASGEINENTELDQNNYVQLLRQPLQLSSQHLIVLTLQVLEGNGADLYWGNTIKLARSESLISDLKDETNLSINSTVFPGRLAANGESVTLVEIKMPFFITAGILILLSIIWAYRENKSFQAGKMTQSLRIIQAIHRYWFVMSQMISRDFKTKYKRSALGVFWSFLNPLLTMIVQYIVFSTLFKSDIPYFSVYLMSGIVFFSFFSEATNMGLLSISGNASLLTKVYIPKYIFPLSRVLSSGINFLFSLIPLLLIILLSGLSITRAYLLLPFTFLSILSLNIGVSLLLATFMTFFRDMQFLWNVLLTMIMYLTPIFYPESILPKALLFVVKCNPMYHVLRLVRSILIDGASPEPKAYLLCFASCIIPLVVGAYVFKKNQNKFVFYL